MKQRRLRTTRAGLSEEEEDEAAKGVAGPAAPQPPKKAPGVNARPTVMAVPKPSIIAPPIVRVGMAGGDDGSAGEEDEGEEEDGPFAGARRAASAGRKARRRARVHRSDAEVVLAGQEQPAGGAGGEI